MEYYIDYIVVQKNNSDKYSIHSYFTVNDEQQNNCLLQNLSESNAERMANEISEKLDVKTMIWGSTE